MQRNNNNRKSKLSKSSKPYKPANREYQAPKLNSILCRQMPNSFKVALNYSQVSSITATAAPQQFTFGLFELLNDRPRYTEQFYEMYKYCKIHAVSVRAEVVANDPAPITIAMATIPFVDITASTTPDDLIGRPRSIYHSVGGSSGLNRAVLSKTYHSFQELGSPVFDKDHWVTSAQSVATTPQDTDAPVICVSVRTTNGVSGGWSIRMKAIYHLEFFALEAA